MPFMLTSKRLYWQNKLGDSAGVFGAAWIGK